MEKYWYLENTDLGKILCPHKLKDFTKEHKVLELNKNEYIYVEQESDENLYLIMKGKVKIGYVDKNGDEYVSSILTKGEVFGEKSVLGQTERNEFAMCLDKNTKVCSISIHKLDELKREHKDLSITLFKIIGFKIQKLERHLELLLKKDVSTRLHELLIDLSKDFGQKEGAKKMVIRHPYTQKDLAKLIGASRQTLNHLLGKLQSENKIVVHQKEIILEDIFFE